MRGFYGINYCIYIKKGNGKTYKFIKQTITMTSNDDKLGVPIDNKVVYDEFFRLFPILKTIPKEDMFIHKAWSTWHPMNGEKEIPSNKYNKEWDEFITKKYLRNKLLWKQ